MPASLITLPILAMSDFIAAANAAGELPTTSDPVSRNFCLTLGWLSKFTISRFSLLTMAAGVLAGTTQALQQEAVSFMVTGPGGPTVLWANTDYLGRAMLPPAGLPGGTYTVTNASFGGNATFAAADLDFTPMQHFTVAKTSQNITFDVLADRTIGSPVFMAYATASSGLPVAFVASGACSAGGSTAG